jgi:MYXO-CTERM domain-containing protein
VGTNGRVDVYLTSFITPVLAEVAASPGARPSIVPGQDTCAVACATDADCPRGMTCLGQEDAPNACALNGLPPGRFGESCDADGCPGGNCVDTDTAGCLCYQFCDAATPPGGGCSVGQESSGWLAIGALVMLAGRRRTRRFLALATLLLAGGCGSRDARGNCPEGTVTRGAAPPAGTFVACEGSEGVRSGPFVEWYASSNPAQKKREGHYKRGKLDGKWVSYFPDGKLERENTYVDGVLEGRSIEYHTTGGKKEEGSVERGTRVGTWTLFHENGKPRKQTAYSDNSSTQRWTLFSEAGVRTHEGMFVNGRKEGLFTEYFPDGKMSVQGTWAESKKHGTWTTWDPSGNVVSKEEYLNGELVPAANE